MMFTVQNANRMAQHVDTITTTPVSQSIYLHSYM